MASKRAFLFHKQTKYSVHLHAYINERGDICVRKRDTNMPDRYDHLDILRYDDSPNVVGSRLRTDGKAHISDKIRKEIEQALEEVLTKCNMSVDYSNKNMVALYRRFVK